MATTSTPKSAQDKFLPAIKSAKTAVNKAKYMPTKARKAEAVKLLKSLISMVEALDDVQAPAAKPKAAGTKGGNTKTGQKLQRKARPARSKAQQDLDKADAASFKRDDEHMEKLVNAAVLDALKRLHATEPVSKPASKRKATVLSHEEIEALKADALESTDIHISYEDCI